MKRIAISQRVIEGAKRDALEQDYVQFYSSFGIVLIPVPNVLADVASYLKALDIGGLILSGGNDVNPSLYGETPEKAVYADERDATEKAILDYAIAHKLPVFCECRGLQFMNVYFGGKLRKVQGHVGTHSVDIEGKKITVNSYHNQGIGRADLASPLQAFAICDDTIEGAYHPKHRIAGIMWHPERDQPSADFTALNKRLVKDFLEGKGYWK